MARGIFREPPSGSQMGGLTDDYDSSPSLTDFSSNNPDRISMPLPRGGLLCYFIGVQYANLLNICEAKSDSFCKSIDKIDDVGVQFPRETIGHQNE